MALAVAKPSRPMLGLALGAGRELRFPGAEIGHELRVIRHVIGKLQRKAAGRMRGEIQQPRIRDGAALQLRHVFAHIVAQRQLAFDRGGGGERRGEGLADRSELEQRFVRHRNPRRLRGQPIFDEMALAIDRDPDRHAGNRILRDDRGNRRIDRLPQLGSAPGSRGEGPARRIESKGEKDGGESGMALRAHGDPLSIKHAGRLRPRRRVRKRN
jgi:hypothetical protein